jgi:hypothetical protein
MTETAKRIAAKTWRDYNVPGTGETMLELYNTDLSKVMQLAEDSDPVTKEQAGKAVRSDECARRDPVNRWRDYRIPVGEPKAEAYFGRCMFSVYTENFKLVFDVLQHSTNPSTKLAALACIRHKDAVDPVAWF